MPAPAQLSPVDENGNPILHKLVRSLTSTPGVGSPQRDAIDLEESLLIFPHPPKCAGRTFSAILDKWFASSGADPKLGLYATGTLYGQFLGQNKTEALDHLAAAPPNLRYLRGHLPYGVHQNLSLQPVYVTFLREPVSRALSHFAFGAERGGWALETPFADVVRAGGILDNPMTRQLAGLRDAREPCTEATLERAISNLSTFGFVGLVEQFDHSLQVFLSRFGLPSIVYLDRGRSKPVDLAERLADDIKPFATFDEVLYQSVKLPRLVGETRNDLWVDSKVISVEPKPGQPIPFAGLELIKATLAERNFDLIEPLAAGV